MRRGGRRIEEKKGPGGGGGRFARKEEAAVLGADICRARKLLCAGKGRICRWGKCLGWKGTDGNRGERLHAKGRYDRGNIYYIYQIRLLGLATSAVVELNGIGLGRRNVSRMRRRIDSSC